MQTCVGVVLGGNPSCGLPLANVLPVNKAKSSLTNGKPGI
jgi:hypothetical protein